MGKFIKAPVEVLLDVELTDPERRVLLALYSFANEAGKCFPGTELLMARAIVNSASHLSRLTGCLVKKGWLFKKRRGYSGRQTYRLSIPARLTYPDLFHEEPVLHGECKSQLHGECKNKLHGECKNKLHGECKNKELTSELTNELTNVVALSHNNNLSRSIGDSGWVLGEKQESDAVYWRADLRDFVYEVSENFIDHFKATGEKCANWDARWRKWVRSEKRRQVRGIV